MKREHPIFLLSEIDEKYISEADPTSFKAAARRKRFFPMLIAAVLCLTLTASLALFLIFDRETDGHGNTDVSDTNQDPQYTDMYPQYNQNGTAHTAKEYSDITEAFIAIYAAPPAIIDESPKTDIYDQYLFIPTHYFTLPHNNKPDNGVKGESSIALDKYIFSTTSDGVKVFETKGNKRTEVAHENIAYADEQDKSDMDVRTMYLSEDGQTLILLLSDGNYTKSAIVTFDISKFHIGKQISQKSFVKISGGYIDSSYINGKLILASLQEIKKETFDITDRTTFLPYTAFDGNISYSDLGNIYITPNIGRAVYTTVTEFDVAADRLINIQSVIGGHDVHITKSAVYLERSYAYGEDAEESQRKSELLRFAYTDEGLSFTDYKSIDGIIYKDMLNESNGVLQVLSGREFYCFDATTGELLLMLSSPSPTYIYQTVKYVGNKAYLGHYCWNGDCDTAFDKRSSGMIVWTQEIDVSNPKSIKTDTPTQPYGSLLDFGDGYWLELRYEHSETGDDYKLWVSVHKETDSGLTRVDSIDFENRGLKYFQPDRHGVKTDEKYCDYYFDKENKLFGTLFALKNEYDPESYMLLKFDTETEKLKLIDVNINKYHENLGAYYANGYFFTVSSAGDLATWIG